MLVECVYYLQPFRGDFIRKFTLKKCNFERKKNKCESYIHYTFYITADSMKTRHLMICYKLICQYKSIPASQVCNAFHKVVDMEAILG